MSAGAWWVREQIAAKGRDVAAWPDATRAALLSLDSATLRDAGLELDRGGRGGASPHPYPDKGHLLGGAVPDGAPEGGRVGDECPGVLVAHESQASAVRDGTSSPVEDARRGVERRRQVAAGNPRAAAGDPGRTWERRRSDRERELELRAAVEAATGRPIVDKRGHPLECNEEGWVYGHRRILDAFRFRVHTCKVRGRCPHCARAYALEQAAELRSLMGAAMQRRTRPLAKHDALGWAFVVTMPRVVSDHLGRLADDPRGRKELRENVTRLVGVARDHVAGMFHVEPRELAASVNVHWWASDNPSRPAWHWHAHVMLPNVQRDGSELRRRAKFAPEALEAGRDRLRGLLVLAWPELLLEDAARAQLPAKKIERERLRGVPLSKWSTPFAELEVPANAHARYFLADEKGARRWRHRSRYDARHPYADVLKEAGRDEGRARLYGDPDGAALERVANRIEDLQSLKLRRYVGWFVPGRRKVVGLAKEEADGDAGEWYALEDGYRRIRSWTPAGLELVRFDRFTGEAISEVMAELVDFDSQGPPVRWAYEEARDASRRFEA